MGDMSSQPVLELVAGPSKCYAFDDLSEVIFEGFKFCYMWWAFPALEAVVVLVCPVVFLFTLSQVMVRSPSHSVDGTVGFSINIFM